MRCSVASPSMHIHSTPWSSRGHEEKREKKKKNRKKEIHPQSAIPFCGFSGCGNREISARQEVTCTYLHHTTPLRFLSPTLLPFQRQATHGPERTHKAAAAHSHLPDTGTAEASRVGPWAALQPARAQPPRPALDPLVHSISDKR